LSFDRAAPAFCDSLLTDGFAFALTEVLALSVLSGGVAPADLWTRQTPTTPTTEGLMEIALVVKELDARLSAAADPDRAPAERAYLKSDLTHLGVGVPATRRAVKATLGDHGPVGHDDLIAAVDALWAATVHERRLAAVEVLTASTDPLSAADAAWLEGLLRACRTRALVDPLAIGVVGVLVEREPPGWGIPSCVGGPTTKTTGCVVPPCSPT
jgi:hypothetical protein